MNARRSTGEAAGAPAADPATPRPGAGRRAPWLALGLAAVVLVVDQLTKLWAERTLTRGERVPVLGDALGIKLVYNPGAALSIGRDATWIFTIVAAAGVLGGLWYVWRVRSRAWAVALGLLLGGATTHLGDRLFRRPSFGQGHVVDFIAYFDWFVGNVADIAIVVGAALMVLLAAKDHPTRPDRAR
ncbi:signal peptidase II [Micromonospora sp. WMMD882]|uniref:signal peptidase II n=1 Tax=Micromonospora sp. WMMD882 TaxID=3015151 RepID=UPI00248BCC19|nr:signal peptidase II [Micromonospora sp. WMMD882]WBB81181.1 signal peptidase II [Micromonospora sp. WMMD882]